MKEKVIISFYESAKAMKLYSISGEITKSYRGRGYVL